MQANILSDIFNTIYNYVSSMSSAEIISTSLIILAAVLFVILERIFPYTKNQKILREGFFDDFAMYTIAQNYILSILIFGVIINFIDNSTGISRLQLFADITNLGTVNFLCSYSRSLHLLDASMDAQE
jgi:hypothetical protein